MSRFPERQSEAARMEQALKRGLEKSEVYFPTVRSRRQGDRADTWVT
jgi:hypothetical protein